MKRDISKVLIVDNDPMFLGLMEDILSNEGIRVLTARDGKQALEILIADAPDILITDLIMPKIAGEQLIEYVRSDSELRDIFVVVMSAALQEYAGLENLKVDYYLGKRGIENTRKALLRIVTEIRKSKVRKLTSELPETDLQPRQIVKELLAERQQKQRVTAAIKDGFIIYDFDHKVLEANSAAEEFLGKSLNSLLNNSVEEIFEYVQQGAINSILGRISRGETDEDHLIINVGAKTLDLHFSSFGNRESDSMPGGMILIYDLTEQELAKKRLGKRVKELSALNQIAQLLNSSLSEEVIFRSLIEKSVDILAAEGGTIALCESNDVHRTNLIFQYTCGKLIENIMGTPINKDHGLIGWVVSHDEAVIIDDVSKDVRFLPDFDRKTDFKTRSVLCAPIRVGKMVIGAIEILNRKLGQFDHSDLTLLKTMVDVASLSLNNSFLHEKIIGQRDYYSGIMSSLNEGVMILSSDLNILDVNQFFLVFFNRDRGDIIGRKCHAVFFDRDNPCNDCFLKEAGIFKVGKDLSCDRILQNSEGIALHFGISGTALEVQDEVVTSVLLTFTDVSSIVRLNTYLNASASIASLLLKGGDIANLIEDVLGIMGRPAGASRCYWFENHKDPSDAFVMSRRAEWCADGIESQMGNPSLQNLPYDDLPRWYKELSCGRIISGPVFSFPDKERSVLEPQGIKCILIIPMFRSEDFAGFIGFDNCANEIPWQDAEVNLLRSATDSLAKAFEHEKVLNELKESNARYADILDNLSDFWYLHDMEGKFIEVNPAAQKATGYTQKELLSMSVNDLIPCRYRHDFKDYLKELRSQGKAEGIIRLVFKNGEEGIFQYRNWLVELPTGLKASRGVVRDVTHKIKLEAQLRHAQKMESMGAITCGISHNFRNILTAIISKSQLGQLKYENSPEFQNFAAEIARLAQTGSELITELLQFSRKDSRGPKTVFNLVEILDETYHMIRQSFDRKIEVLTDWPQTLLICGKRSSLSQVFMNLCTNARDAMPDGGILRMEGKKAGDRATITISDTGCGMDSETMQKAFDPFFTTKEPDKGTGLGLFMAYSIVKEHQGEIQIESEPGRGTSFEIHFPWADTVEQDNEKTSSETEIVRGNGEKVLVVDDDETMLCLFEELLTDIGYIVKAVESGERAIEEYKTWHPDVVLLDRNMPGMDGVNTARIILSMDSDAKMIYLSGYEAAEADAVEQQLKTCIKGYITKPFDVSYLSHALADAIKQ